MSLELTTTAAAVLPLNEDSTADDFASARMMIDAVRERVKELDEQWKSAALERCQKSGDLLIGHRRFYAGREKDVKVRSMPDAVEAIFRATGGDWDGFVACLSSSALKPGACRKALPPEDFAAVFEEIDRTLLKTGEPTKKQLMEIDTRYMR